MPELLPTRLSAQLRRMTLSMACALPLCGLPAGAWAQGTSAGLRACTAQSDPGRRLACYDREMGRSLATPTRGAQPTTGPAPSPAPAPAASAPSTPSAAPPLHTEVAPSAAPQVAGNEAAAPPHASRWKILSTVAGGDWHMTAQVARLERSPDSMVLHLDNGQVWRQIGRASGDLSLHEGDSVTIEKHLGSYWLSSRYVSNMKVRQESP
jgi:hypothetical protein